MIENVDDPLRRLTDVLKPDERQSTFPCRLQDVHAMLSALVLHDGVPVEVRQLFETAKNVRLYTYFVYRFHQVAEMTAYQALEMALLIRWKRESPEPADSEGRKLPTLGPLLQEAANKGWIYNEGFSGREWRAENAIQCERAVAAIVALQGSGANHTTFVEPSLAGIADRAKTIDVVSALAKALPRMRNDLAHGSTKLIPISDHVLRDVSDAINMLFKRAG